MKRQGGITGILGFSLVLPFLVLVAGCGGDARPAASTAPAPAAGTDPAADATPAPDVVQLSRDRSPALCAQALTSDGDDTWAVRLEALRQIRHQRPPGLAPALIRRILATRSDQEQVIALDVLFGAYPAEAANAIAQFATAFAGERIDLDRLASAILHHRCVAGYATALDILETGGEDDLTGAAEDLADAGPALASLLNARADVTTNPPARRALDRALAGLADPAAAENARIDADVIAADFPPAATAVALAREPAVIGALAHASFAAGVVRPDIIGALARSSSGAGSATGAADVAPALLGLLTPPQLPETRTEQPVAVRAACLHALGDLHVAAALPFLLAAANDDTVVAGAVTTTGGLRSGGDSWPLAEAAVAGLATMPGDAAKQAILGALAKSDRPSLVVAAAEALARRGDKSVLSDLDQARAALDAEKEASSWSVNEAMAALMDKPAQTLYQVYLVRYRGPDLSFTLVTDQPLIPGIGVHVATNPPWTVSQESFLMTADDITRAISQRNAQRLDRLVYGPDKINDVDLLAR